jgi:hypothetical protein
MGNQQRKQLKECLIEKTVFPGSKLIEEGKYCNLAFMIREGECSLSSHISPKQIHVDENGSIVIKPKPAWN